MSKSALATGQNPSIQVSKAGIEPPPVPSQSDKWVLRTTQQEVSVPKATSAGQQVSVAAPGNVVGGFLDKVSIWGIGTQSLYVTLLQGQISDLGDDNIVASDYSSLAQCPGITFKVPMGHASEINSTASAQLKIDCLGDIAFKAIVHWHSWVRY